MNQATVDQRSSRSATLSVVVPVHNEQAILREQTLAIVEAFKGLGHRFEMILVENGSRDATPEICRQLEVEVPQLRTVTVPVGDYGIALKEGILAASNDVVIIFNVEFWSVEFVDIALAALRSRTLVIGSKAAPGAFDNRGLLRRLVTRSYNRVLRIVWGFDGTDTHGMKAFWREPLLRLVKECVTVGWVFDTELVLRAQRSGFSKLELPTPAKELRAPSVVTLVRRVPSVLTNLWRLSRHVPPYGRPRQSPAVPDRTE